MDIYSKCAKCGHQQMFYGNNFDQKPCPECGEGMAHLSFGSKPKWWVETFHSVSEWKLVEAGEDVTRYLKADCTGTGTPKLTALVPGFIRRLDSGIVEFRSDSPWAQGVGAAVTVNQQHWEFPGLRLDTEGCSGWHFHGLIVRPMFGDYVAAKVGKQ